MSVERQLLMGAAGAATVASDPYFNQTTLLLHGDGTNGAQNNTFIDSSTNNFTITRNGNTTQGTFTPFSQAAGYWSNGLDGSSAFSVANNAALELGSSDFTIECWYYQTAPATYSNLVAKVPNASTYASYLLDVTTLTPRISLSTSGSSYAVQLASSTNIVNNTWNHIAAVRNGSTVTLYLNGASVGTASISGSLYAGSYTLGIGAYGGGTYPASGYLSNVRIVKGSAVYTSAFTPSTTPLTAITNTSLLTCQSNRFVDNSANNFTLTPSGMPSVQPFSPFAPTAAYSTTVNGGSGYFDGSGDVLRAGSNAALDFSTSSCTLESWIYLTTYPSVVSLIIGQPQTSGSAAYSIQIAVFASGALAFYSAASSGGYLVSLSGGSAKLNTWNHVAGVRNGNTWTLYVNGVSVATSSSSHSVSQGSGSYGGLDIGGGYVANDYYLFGYLESPRVVIGSAVYTANFTPPAAPLTAITNTQLLLSCTNAGIYDNAIKNDLETVGNAQISTSVKKYGTGSMAFDGTGDWLLLPDSANLQFGSGNFTIEGWVYLSTTGTAKGIVGKGASTTGWLVSINSSNQLVFTDGSTATTGATALSATTWYYFAVVRNGTATGNVKIYLNGTADATSSGAITTSYTQTNSMYVGADRTGTNAMNGYIDDLRITNGVARYTANFTPPTSAFPNQ